MFSRTQAETTGHDLLGRQEEAAQAYHEALVRIRAEAEDRAAVVEARLQELEAEKLVLNALGFGPLLHDDDALL